MHTLCNSVVKHCERTRAVFYAEATGEESGEKQEEEEEKGGEQGFCFFCFVFVLENVCPTSLCVRSLRLKWSPADAENQRKREKEKREMT